MRHLRLLLAVLFCCASATALEAQSAHQLPIAAELRPSAPSPSYEQFGSTNAVDALMRTAVADDSLTEHHWERYALVGAVIGGVASAALVASNSSLPGCGTSGSPGFCTGARVLVVGAGIGIGAFGGWLAARLTR